MPTTGWLRGLPPIEPGTCVAVAEDAAVGRDQPVPVSVGGRGHADDGPVEPERTGRAEEPSVAETEDAAVGADQPVAAAVGRGDDPDDRRVQRNGQRPVVVRGAERPHGAVGFGLPVTRPVRHGGHADRLVPAISDERLLPRHGDIGGRAARGDEFGGQRTSGYPAGSSAAPSERVDGCAPQEGSPRRMMSRCIQQDGDPAEVQASLDELLPAPSEYIQ